MCLSETQAAAAPPRDRLSPPKVLDGPDAKLFSTTLEAMACRPSWTLRNIFKPQNIRPGGTKRLHGSAKINLNNYWGVLEQLAQVSPRAAVEDTDMANEINDNLSNERAEEGTEQRGVAMEADCSASASSSQEAVEATPRNPIASSLPVKKKEVRQKRARAKPRTPKPAPPLPPAGRSPLATVNGMENHKRSPQLSPLSCITEHFSRRLGRLT